MPAQDGTVMSSELFSPSNDVSAVRGSLQRLYVDDPRPWLVGFSGGKDSTLVVALVFDTVLSVAPKQRGKEVHFVCTDTRVEIPAVVETVETTLARMRKFAAENTHHEQAMAAVPQSLRGEQSLPVQLEADDRGVRIQAHGLLRLRQRSEEPSLGVIGGQECLLAVENRWIGILGVVRAPGLTTGQVDRDGVMQCRVRVNEEPWVRQKGDLEFICAELEHIELSANLVALGQAADESVKPHRRPHQTLSMHIQGRCQPLAMRHGGNQGLVFGQRHAVRTLLEAPGTRQPEIGVPQPVDPRVEGATMIRLKPTEGIQRPCQENLSAKENPGLDAGVRDGSRG